MHRLMQGIKQETRKLEIRRILNKATFYLSLRGYEVNEMVFVLFDVFILGSVEWFNNLVHNGICGPSVKTQCLVLSLLMVCTLIGSEFMK